MDDEKSRITLHKGDNSEKEIESPTVYDNVFRTLTTRRTELIIPLINELFSLHIPEDAKISLKNDVHFLGGKKLETDSIFQIGDLLFQIECESSKTSGNITIRIMEYNLVVALESMEKDNNGIYHIQLPRSGIVKLRENSRTPDSEKVILHSPEGKTMEIKFQTLKAQSYNIDAIFEKKLYFLIPFYLLRYDKLKKFVGEEKSELKRQMIRDLKEIINRLYRVCKEEGREEIYGDIQGMIQQVAMFLFQEQDIRKEVNNVARGIILPLPSDKIREAVDKALSEEVPKAVDKAMSDKEANMQKDIAVVGPLLKERKDDDTIALVTGWPIEKVAKYRSMLSVLL